MKKILLFGIPIIGIIILVLLAIFYSPPQPEGNEYFTLEPESWIEQNEQQPNDPQVEINLFKATRAKSIFADNLQQDYFLDDGSIQSFTYRGGYQGIPFRTAYVDEEFYNLSWPDSAAETEQLAKQYLRMRIAPQMNPEDGIINGFILAKKTKNDFVFYIFVDEDWKKKLEYTNLLWGDDFTDPSTLQLRPFNFKKTEKGIYIDKLATNIGWYKKNPSAGGIVVGEIDQKLLRDIINQQETNKTFMYIR